MAAVPGAAVGFLLQNLKEFVTSSADLIAKAEENVDLLMHELEELKTFLNTCREAYNDEEFLDKLAKDVRKLVYRAEDAIEIYIATASKQKTRTAIQSALHAVDHAMELRNLGKELESIKEEVRRINTTKANLGFEAMRLNNPREHEQRVKKLPVDDDMVGFKDAMEDVISFLCEGPENLEIVSIVGMSGLGKTTLARNVFNHPTVEYHFSIRAFVEVSQEYRTKEVFLKILRCFISITREMNSMSSDELAQQIRNYLEKRDFLIVLDDVWTPEAWDDLKRAFPNNQKRSRVLITTRQMNVAHYARQGLQPYRLRLLTDDESRELLRQKVFGKDPFPSELAESVERILHRCVGLPLNIVVIAGILINHRTKTHWWMKVAANLDIYSLAATERVSHAINLSFNNLPYDLKPCFLYLGVFHEGFEIPSKTLLQLWVSEGFVLPVTGGKSLEDTAEDCLEELAARSLVMVDKRRLDGRIKTIRIHDTLREFSKSQAMKEELFREIRMSSANISPYDDRRLCINSNILEYIKSKPSGKYVRSFLSFANQEYYIPPVEYISVIPKAFKLVRVLDIRSIMLIRFPSELYYLFLLKYIAMSLDLKIIPEKMSNLRYLQTLLVETMQSALEIKADILKLAHLRHLETNVSTSLVTTKEDNGHSNLQTLSKISPKSCGEVIDRVPQLKKLGICGKLESSLDDLLDTLSKLESLENLKLMVDDKADTLRSLRSESIFPANLTRLTLQNTNLDWGCMCTLAKLERLKVLKLKDNAFSGPHWEAENGAFPALEVLHIAVTDPVTWKASASYFPHLRQLYLKHCSKLEAIPSDLVKINALQLIDIYCCNGSVNSSAEKLKAQVQDKDMIKVRG